MDAPVAPVRPRGNGPKPPPSFSAVDVLTVSGEETCLQVKHPGGLEKDVSEVTRGSSSLEAMARWSVSRVRKGVGKRPSQPLANR